MRVIAAWLECFPEKPSWCRNEHVCQGRKSVKHFELSNGLDTAPYKNIPFLFCFVTFYFCLSQEQNDALKNDEIEDVDPPTLQALKELGAFGLQVPTKYGTLLNFVLRDG